MTEPDPRYDLLLKGGRVIDPRNEIDATMDVAVADGKIAAVAENIPSQQAEMTADVASLIVTPGLVDIHTHVYGYEHWVQADEYAFPNGVTTMVDAGGSGYRTFDEFRGTVVEEARVRVLALVNIVASGMLGAVEQDVSELQAEPCAEVVRRNRDLVVGVKTAHYRGAGWEAIDEAVEAAESSDTFVMVDYRDHPNRSDPELLLEHMRPGDVHTHMYSRASVQVDEDGKVPDYIWEARERGVLFDVGHGKGSFVYDRAVPSIEQGHVPHTISTDVHGLSYFLTRATMPVVMSKLMMLGMSLKDAIAKSTSVPATVIGRPELGALSVGAEADIAAFEVEDGSFGFLDCSLARMEGKRLLTCHLTIRAGKVVWDLNGISRPLWGAAGDS